MVYRGQPRGSAAEGGGGQTEGPPHAQVNILDGSKNLDPRSLKTRGEDKDPDLTCNEIIKPE